MYIGKHTLKFTIILCTVLNKSSAVKVNLRKGFVVDILTFAEKKAFTYVAMLNNFHRWIKP